MRQQVFDVEDEIADKRDAMIDSLEQRLHRSSKAENLFVVKIIKMLQTIIFLFCWSIDYMIHLQKI